MGFSTIEFDKYNPASEKASDARQDLAHLDYSPLKRITGRSWAMGILISMGGMVFGYDTGQVSGFLEMPDFLDRFGERSSPDAAPHFSNVRSGLIVGLLSIGTLIGALVAAPIADRFGRRNSISFWCLITSIGFVIQIAAERAWEQIMVGRMVAGFGVGALSLIVPMFQAETAPPWIRGALVCAYQLFITLGIFLAACFNYGTVTHQPNSSASWRIVIGLGWLWTIILGVGVLAFPETPRYNYRMGKVEEAKQTLCRVYGAPENHYSIFVQLEEIESKLRAESQIKGSAISEFTGMFKAPRMAHRIILGCLLQMFQQLTGANFFFYYGTTIFASVNINSFITQIILNTINFLTTFIGLYIVEHYGRRKSLITGALWMFICFLIFASVGHFSLNQDDPTATKGPGIVLIVFACLFILGFATTWGPMIWTIQAELFPSRYRAKAMSLSTASNWVWNFCIGFFSPFITGAIDFRYGYVFAGCNLVAAALVYFFVIEGQGRTLEEIDTMYLERVTPWKSTQWVPPSAEQMAQIRRKAGTELDASGSDTALNAEKKDGSHSKGVNQDTAHQERV
ncbi:Hexose transporter 2 [Colletotrichum trifolii]|uniref:Hexose transporter 2 n=1 Tax=Colletotrichum trifolii TaxID=5466 RepID=A0A4R8RDC5_COLTR|nr:Hexose transporter 2 [Colletotrichum trifolii]